MCLSSLSVSSSSTSSSSSLLLKVGYFMNENKFKYLKFWQQSTESSRSWSAATYKKRAHWHCTKITWLYAQVIRCKLMWYMNTTVLLVTVIYSFVNDVSRYLICVSKSVCLSLCAVFLFVLWSVRQRNNHLAVWSGERLSFSFSANQNNHDLVTCIFPSHAPVKLKVSLVHCVVAMLWLCWFTTLTSG